MKKPYIDLGIKWGVILALIVCAFRIALFYIDVDLSTTSAIQYVTSGIVLAGLVVMGLQARKIAGSLTYSNAFLSIFIAILINTLISGTAIYASMATADAERMEELKKITLEKEEKRMEEWNVPEEKIAERLEYIEEHGPLPPLGWYAVGMVFLIIFYTLLGLIIAAIVKKKPNNDVFIATNPDETAS